MKTIPTTLAVVSVLPASLSAFDLHEWGTFTTVSGSDGALLHVKVKMETPVIYFHSEEAFRAQVKVAFKGGTISQWYPQRSAGEVFKLLDENGKRTTLDFAQPYTGSIEWDVEVLSADESRNTIQFKPDDLVQWTRARVPEANVVRTGNGETEGFLFYRGLGSFEPGLKTTVSIDETLTLTNHTGNDIPYLLVYEKLPNGTHRWTQHHGLGAGASVSFTEKSLAGEENPWRWTTRPEGVYTGLTARLSTQTDEFDQKLYRTLSNNLAAQGLLPSEAEAMVQTWWKSYFDASGLRVFWVLPDALTDEILPLEITPKAENTVRVMVGRSEVIRPSQEQEWLANASSKDEATVNQWNGFISSDRFGAAYLERVDALKQ